MHIGLPPRKSGQGRLKPPGCWLALLLPLHMLQAYVLQVTGQNWVWGCHNWGENSTIGRGGGSKMRAQMGQPWPLLRLTQVVHQKPPRSLRVTILHCPYPMCSESPWRPHLPCSAILQQARDNRGHREYEMKISPAVSTNEKCHSHQHSLASICEWGFPKLWSSRCHHAPWIAEELRKCKKQSSATP